MEEEFEITREDNQFDNLKVCPEQVFTDFPFGNMNQKDAVKKDRKFNLSPFQKLYSLPWFPLRYRNFLWKLFHRINLDQTWFESFSSYWSEVLGGRPLWGTQDLFFLKNNYRIRFQNKQLPDTNSAGVHLQAWQEPEVLYLLLHYAAKESIANYADVVQLYKKYAPNSKKLLEYGCSCAPITTSIFEFTRPTQDQSFYLCDLQSIAFHYGAYKFRNFNNVFPVLLKPEDNFQFKYNEKFDVIFCLMVFEHLNEPLETVKRFHQMLNPGGVLFLDYIKGDGDGHDTIQAVEQRNDVLDYVDKHFSLLHGNLCSSESIGLTVVKK
jgi:hypothetical protein